MTQTPPDPVIDEIRDVRHRISERFGHDGHRLVTCYATLHEEYRERLLKASREQGKGRTFPRRE